MLYFQVHTLLHIPNENVAQEILFVVTSHEKGNQGRCIIFSSTQHNASRTNIIIRMNVVIDQNLRIGCIICGK